MSNADEDSTSITLTAAARDQGAASDPLVSCQRNKVNPSLSTLTGGTVICFTIRGVNEIVNTSQQHSCYLKHHLIYFHTQYVSTNHKGHIEQPGFIVCSQFFLALYTTKTDFV